MRMDCRTTSERRQSRSVTRRARKASKSSSTLKQCVISFFPVIQPLSCSETPGDEPGGLEDGKLCRRGYVAPRHGERKPSWHAAEYRGYFYRLGGRPGEEEYHRAQLPFFCFAYGDRTTTGFSLGGGGSTNIRIPSFKLRSRRTTCASISSTSRSSALSSSFDGALSGIIAVLSSASLGDAILVKVVLDFLMRIGMHKIIRIIILFAVSALYPIGMSTSLQRLGALMEQHVVFAILANHEVRWRIVRLIFIYVMDFRTDRQWPSEYFLSYPETYWSASAFPVRMLWTYAVCMWVNKPSRYPLHPPHPPVVAKVYFRGVSTSALAQAWRYRAHRLPYGILEF